MTNAEPASPRVPTRAELARARVVSRGGFANPDVLLWEAGAARAIVKDFAPRSALVRATLGRLIARREQRAWRALAGHEAVPRYLGAVDALAFAVEHRAGAPLSRSVARGAPPEFFARLETAIADMHVRGVVHLDLRHQGNVLVGEDGAPVLLDFGSALVFARGSACARAAVTLLGWIDRSAVAKWRRYASAAQRSDR